MKFLNPRFFSTALDKLSNLVIDLFENHYQKVIIFLIFILFATNIYVTLNNIHGHDFWEHASAISRFLQDFNNPSHPAINKNLPHPFLNPYTFLLAFLAQKLNISAIEIMNLVSFFQIGLLLISLKLILLAFKTNTNISRSYSIFITLSLFAWAKPPIWSGFINYESLIYVFAYPSTFCLSLSFIICYLFNKLISSDFNIYYIIKSLFIILATSFILLTHSITFCFLGLLIFINLYINNNINIRNILHLLFLFFASIAIIINWPYFSFFKLYTDPTINTFSVHYDSIILYDRIILRYFTFWIFILLLIKLKRNRKYLISIILLCLIIFIGYFFKFFALGRLISYTHIMLFLFIATSSGLKQVIIKHTQLFSISFILILFLQIGVFTRSWLTRDEYKIELNQFLTKELSTHFTSKDVIAVSQNYINPFPSFGCSVLYSVAPSYWISDNETRKSDNNSLFDPNSPVEKKIEIIEKYGVNYFILLKKDAAVLENEITQKLNFKVVKSNKYFKLFTLKT
ncbi:MAG: hypothetical protein WAT92_06490 [Saprospiraceae bacterium]